MKKLNPHLLCCLQVASLQSQIENAQAELKYADKEGKKPIRKRIKALNERLARITYQPDSTTP